MRRRFMRWAIAGLLVLVGAVCPVAGIAYASQAVTAQPAAAESGQLEDLDREFLTVIRFANLWEIPMGQLATERGNTQTVRDVGAVLAEDHTALDVTVKELAARFDVTLPAEPTSSQRSWMAEISSKEGADFDRVFADRLRAAHGTVFGLIAEVRAGTRNAVIREFAQQANNVVMKHMTLLESTGNITADHGMFAEASARTAAYPENHLGRGDLFLGGILVLVTVAGTLVLLRIFSARGAAE